MRHAGVYSVVGLSGIGVECARTLVFVADGQQSNEKEESAAAASVLGKFSHKPQSNSNERKFNFYLFVKYCIQFNCLRVSVCCFM